MHKDSPSVAVTRSPRRGLHSLLPCDEPPPLNYTIKIGCCLRAIIIRLLLLFVEAGIIPLILKFSLCWVAHLSSTKNITSLIGTFSGCKFTQHASFLWLAREYV
ncbi:hypothetical protein FOMPIDRAFT_101161, partial [Fomitopsis schrenkii]